MLSPSLRLALALLALLTPVAPAAEEETPMSPVPQLAPPPTDFIAKSIDLPHLEVNDFLTNRAEVEAMMADPKLQEQDRIYPCHCKMIKKEGRIPSQNNITIFLS